MPEFNFFEALSRMSHRSCRNVAILGSTGSIGTATLDVVRGLGNDFRVWALSAHLRLDDFCSQLSEFKPARAVVTSDCTRIGDSWLGEVKHRSPQTALKFGPDALVEIAEAPEVDIVVAAIVGSAGLHSALAAARAGKTLALANKESLVVAGSLMMEAVRKHGSRLLPVDSEHSAIFQALASGRSSTEVRRLVLTASGGSLRNRSLTELDDATLDEVLAHPTWNMGKKITVDSATMMNKALEVIEARWLFDMEPSKISVVIHPQSMIHSMVEFVDGSVIAQLSPPDMRLPIQYALTYPDRLAGPAKRMDWTQAMEMDWKPADLERYPALELGFEVARVGGSAGAVLNAANEAAVELFIHGKIRFTDIVRMCRSVLNSHDFDPSPTLDQLLTLDSWARKEVLRPSLIRH